MANPKITVERDGGRIAATCAQCGHEVIKADKRLAVQHMIGHLAGRHKADLNALLNGDITIVDKT